MTYKYIPNKKTQMYKAILFHPDGDNVSDFRNTDTKRDVWEKVADMGSRWIFYPIPFVATDTTIVETPEGLEFLKGKRIKTVARFFKQQWEERKDEISELMEVGAPLNHIYN